MNVLSLFDGMSCGQIALEKSGFQVDKYFASEIDKHAMQVARANYPDMVHLGDVRDIKAHKNGELFVPLDRGYKIDLLIGGSPCQGFSFAGKQLNFDDPRSKLFWEYVRLLRELQPKYFLLENVKMKQQSMDVITEALGVEPVLINSSLVSAQNRPRYYWTNIPMDGLPDDKGIVMRDILETEPVAAHYEAGKHLVEGYKGGNQLNPTYKSQANTIHPLDGKSGTLCAGTHGYSNGYVPTRNGLMMAGHADLKGHDYVRRVYHPDGKAPALCASSGGNLEPKTTVTDTTWRKLTPLECERLQTVPDNYTAHVSNTQRYKMLGNGWTVDVITHILKGMNT